MYIKKVMSWNGYPRYIRDKVLRNLVDKDKNSNNSENSNIEDENVNEIFIKLPYCGLEGERLMSKCTKRIARQLSSKVKFKTIFVNKKIMDFCSVKDPIPLDQKHNAVYEIQCPGCNTYYIGKTNCCTSKRMHEHAEKSDQPMFLHFSQCESFKDSVSIMNLPDIDQTDNSVISPESHMLSAILDNYKVLDINHNVSKLAFLETYYIRKNKPDINDGLKGCANFKVFDF